MSFKEHIWNSIRCPNCHCGNLRRPQEQTNITCPDCGMSFAVIQGIPNLIKGKPAPKEDFDYLDHYTLDSEVFDYFEERSGATEHSERRLREYILSMVPKNSPEILDVGCGSAWVAKHFVPLGTNVCSLDASVKNPSRALALYPGGNHAGISADAFDLPFKDGSFSLVIASEIIEHVPDPAAFVKELFRVVKPGGALVLSTPYKEVIRYELCIHCHQLTPYNAHLHSFDEKKIGALYRENDVKSYSWFAFNNKLLLFARTYVILRFLPLAAWKFFDSAANLVAGKPVNMIARFEKR